MCSGTDTIIILGNIMVVCYGHMKLNIARLSRDCYAKKYNAALGIRVLYFRHLSTIN